MGTSITARQMSKAIDQLEEKGVTAQIFQDRVLGSGVWSAIGEAAVAGEIDAGELRQFLNLAPLEELRMTVDYGQTLVKMIAAGHYDWVNIDITAKNFPIVGKGKQKLVSRLIHFNRDISSDDVGEKLDTRGLRAATIAELLAFGMTFPEVQRKFPIIALGSLVLFLGSLHAAYLCTDDAERCLHLHWRGDVWPTNWRFLAVPK